MLNVALFPNVLYSPVCCVVSMSSVCCMALVHSTNHVRLNHKYIMLDNVKKFAENCVMKGSCAECYVKFTFMCYGCQAINTSSFCGKCL